jgi:hypothetical protein
LGLGWLGLGFGLKVWILHNLCTKIYYSYYARTLFSIHIREILKEQAIKQNGIGIGLKFIISFVFAMMS